MRASGRARLRLALILGLAALLYLPPVWNRDLWNPDEPRYAEAAREMGVSADYVLPSLNGESYFEKPPLFFWLSDAAGSLPGIPAGSGGKLVSAAASTGTMILTWRIAALIMGEATGALAALLLGTTVLFWHVGQSGVIDPLLTFLCTLALFGFTRHLLGRRGGMMIFYLACGMGVLAKGPVGFLIPALAALLFTLLHGGPRALAARHPLWGIPLVVVPVALWIAAGTLGGGGREFLETMLVRQNLGRAVDAYIHKEPVYYFALTAPFLLLPWSFFLPHALVVSLKEKVCGVKPMLLPFAWFVTTFVFFSLVSSKKTRYMLPLCPAAALLVAGWLMRRLMETGGRLKQGRALLLALAACGLALAILVSAFAIGGVRALPASMSRPLMEPGSETALEVISRTLEFPANLIILVPAGVFAAACLSSLVLSWRRRGEAFPIVLAAWAAVLACAALVWTPVANEIKSARPLADQIRPLIGGGPLYYLRSNHEGALNFYLPVEHIPVITGGKRAREALHEPGALFIASTDDFRLTTRHTGVSFRPLTCRRVGARVLCLARTAGG